MCGCRCGFKAGDFITYPEFNDVFGEKHKFSPALTEYEATMAEQIKYQSDRKDRFYLFLSCYRDKEDHVKVLSYNTESTALEAESKLRNVIRHNFGAARSAFLKFDPKQKRRVSLLDLRHALAAEWNITMSDSEFEKFKVCLLRSIVLIVKPPFFQTLIAGDKQEIDYEEFMARFETHESVDSHKWLKSNHK